MNQPEPQSDVQVADEVILPESSVYFEPSQIKSPPNEPQTVDISVDTMGKEITGALIVVNYDPNLIKSVNIAQLSDPTSALSSSFTISSVETTPESISLILNSNLDTPAQKGKGKIATLTFIPVTSVKTSMSLTGTTLSNRAGGPGIGLILTSLEITPAASQSEQEIRLQQQTDLLESTSL